MLAFGVSGLSGGHVFIKWTTFSAKGRYFEKIEMPAQWTGLTIIIFWVDWLILKKCDPALSTLSRT
jgi:hypothetical protein